VVGEAVEEARRRQADDKEDGAEGEEAMRWRSGGGGGSSARGTRPRLCFRFFFFFALAGEFGGWTEGGGEKEGRKRVCCVYGWTGRRRGERKLNGAGRCCRVPGRVEINWHEDFLSPVSTDWFFISGNRSRTVYKRKVRALLIHT
jgi:hypothetical protein